MHRDGTLPLTGPKTERLTKGRRVAGRSHFRLQKPRLKQVPTKRRPVDRSEELAVLLGFTNQTPNISSFHKPKDRWSLLRTTWFLAAPISSKGKAKTPISEPPDPVFLERQDLLVWIICTRTGFLPFCLYREAGWQDLRDANNPLWSRSQAPPTSSRFTSHLNRSKLGLFRPSLVGSLLLPQKQSKRRFLDGSPPNAIFDWPGLQ